MRMNTVLLRLLKLREWDDIMLLFICLIILTPRIIRGLNILFLALTVDKPESDDVLQREPSTAEVAVDIHCRLQKLLST